MNQGLRRRLATGTNAAIVTVFLVATIGIAVDLAGRFRLRVDLTEDAVATLDESTLSALAQAEKADGAVEVIAVGAQLRNEEAFRKNRMMQDFLRELEYTSSGVTTRFVDLDADRALAEELEITRYGTVVVRHGLQRVDLKEREIFRRQPQGKDKPVELFFRGEGLVASAISQVLAGEPRAVYVLQGHGERDIGDTSAEGLSLLAQYMGEQGWKVDTLDLLRDRDEGQVVEVPDDASAVLVVRPKVPLAPQEEQALREFVGLGGGVGFYLEPGGVVPDLVEELGFTLPEGTVRDQAAVWPNEDWPILRYRAHPITEDLIADEIKTLVARAAPIQHREHADAGFFPILRTSRGGWVERGTERPAVYTEGVDLEGPVEAAVAVELRPNHPITQPGRRGRAIVFGDSDMVADELMARLGNPTLAVNAVRWLMGQDERMALVGRPGRMRHLELSPEAVTRIGWLVMALWPLLAVLAGLGVFFLRRSR